MPLIQNPTLQSDSILFQKDVESLLRTYCAFYILSESTVLSPNAGYKAYEKKIAFAQKAKNNPEFYTKLAADLISQIDAQMVSFTYPNNYAGVSFYRFLKEDNQTSRNLLENSADIGYNNVGTNSGRSIFEALAGVTQADYI